MFVKRETASIILYYMTKLLKHKFYLPQTTQLKKRIIKIDLLKNYFLFTSFSLSKPRSTTLRYYILLL